MGDDERDHIYEDTHSMLPALHVDWSEHEVGFSWKPVGDGAAERHSHALRDGDGGVWLVDPIDCLGLDDEIETIGAVVGVIVLFGRHVRDAEPIALRHGAPMHVPTMTIAAGSNASTYDTELPGTPFTVVPVRDFGSIWHERALWWPENGVLVVAESLGSAASFRAGTDARLAVHPLLRIAPPRAAFRQASPRVVLCGHGPAITDGAAAAVQLALDESRRKAPRFALGAATEAIASVLQSPTSVREN